jgi:hypothetical protein
MILYKNWIFQRHSAHGVGLGVGWPVREKGGGGASRKTAPVNKLKASVTGQDQIDTHSALNDDVHVAQTAEIAVGNFAVSCPPALFFWHVNSITKEHIFHADKTFSISIFRVVIFQ